MLLIVISFFILVPDSSAVRVVIEFFVDIEGSPGLRPISWGSFDSLKVESPKELVALNKGSLAFSVSFSLELQLGSLLACAVIYRFCLESPEYVLHSSLVKTSSSEVCISASSDNFEITLINGQN